MIAVSQLLCVSPAKAYGVALHAQRMPVCHVLQVGVLEAAAQVAPIVSQNRERLPGVRWWAHRPATVRTTLWQHLHDM